MGEDRDKVEGPGFVIVDKRIGARKPGEEYDRKEGQQSTTKAEEKRQEEARPKKEEKAELPDVDFGSFIISISTSVFIHLGEIPDPATNETHINLAMAKQTIDLITMLKQKTEGNRTEEEDKLIEEMLYNMRLQFIDVSNKMKK